MIRVENVSKWYGIVVGINRVSLALEPGVTGLLGVNGAGKSTLLNLMGGLLKPSTGKITLDGARIFGNPEALRKLGYCPSIDKFYEELTGEAFVAYMGRLSGLPAREARRRASEALEEVALGGEGRKKIRRMSKGMRQKVKMAQALVHDPAVLLLDEPLNGMDPPSRAQTIKMIRKWGNEGKCVVVSSHVLHEVEAMTSRILLLHHGRVLASGEVPEVREAIASRPLKVFLRCGDGRDLGASLIAWPMVKSLEFGEDARNLTVEVTDAGAFYAELGKLLAGRDFDLEILNPLDDNLAAVFQYLVA
ncbi:MAG: ABC transporter ATP-binding protein [Acidobacteriota bacterium]